MKLKFDHKNNFFFKKILQNKNFSKFYQFFLKCNGCSKTGALSLDGLVTPSIGILTKQMYSVVRFLPENVKIFQGNLVTFAGKSNDFYKKI